MDALTNYVILRKPPESPLWVQFTAQYAKNARTAIAQALEGQEYFSGEYLAVPTRYWHAFPVKDGQLV